MRAQEAKSAKVAQYPVADNIPKELGIYCGSSLLLGLSGTQMNTRKSGACFLFNKYFILVHLVMTNISSTTENLEAHGRRSTGQQAGGKTGRMAVAAGENGKAFTGRDGHMV
jgi:hypothetical protein